MVSFSRALIAVSTAIAATAAPMAAQMPAPLKLAFVDTREILQQAPGRAEAEAQFNKEILGFQDQVKKMSDAITTMIADYQKQQAALAPAERDKRQKAIQDKQAEAQQRTQELDQQAQQRQAELMQPILDQIKLVLEDMRVEGGYTFIFDIGQGNSSIVAADKNLNLSDRVIAKLRTLPAPAVVTKPDAEKPAAKPGTGAPLAAPAGVTRPKPSTEKP